MMPANLTAADLDAIEARWASVGRRVPGGPDRAYEAIPDPRPDIARLLSALRDAWDERDEARALVETLVVVEPVCYRPYPDGWECLACNVTVAKRRNLQHAPDCAWDAARKAREAWGGGDAD
jgi:hypothetical protein